MDNPARCAIFRHMEHDADILIVGGGLNGPARALALAQGGLRSVVVDAGPARARAEAGFDPSTGVVTLMSASGGAEAPRRAALDAMGGLACMAAIGARHMDETPEQRLHRFGKLGTIDLRIDYLRSGIGEYF